MTGVLRYRTDASALGAKTVPLVIDVDGTLLQTDLLHETAISYLAGNPLRLFQIVGWLMGGRAQLKHKLAAAGAIDVETLPANPAVVALAKKACEDGRAVHLASASSELLTGRVAERFDFVTGHMGSDGALNLKGAVKAAALHDKFPDGFDYVGDADADLEVFRRARSFWVVGDNAGLLQQARELPGFAGQLPADGGAYSLLSALRPHQWAKNLLVFVPGLLSNRLMEADGLFATLVAFVAFCLLSSATYLINDLCDLPNDRRHWSKNKRAIARGAVSISTACITVAVLLAASAVCALLLGWGAAAVLAAYLVITLGYTFWLKQVPLLDCFALACLFTLRLAIGTVASGSPWSHWLLVFAMFFFGSLSLAKRYTELSRRAGLQSAGPSGRGYVAEDAVLVLGLGLATATTAINVLIFYIINDAFLMAFSHFSAWLWAMPAIVTLFLFRIWLVSQRGQMHDDPIVFALKDTISLALGGLLGVCLLVAKL